MNNNNISHCQRLCEDINIFVKIKVGINVFSAKTFRRRNFSQGKNEDKFINKIATFLKKFSPVRNITLSVKVMKWHESKQEKNLKTPIRRTHLC